MYTGLDGLRIKPKGGKCENGSENSGFMEAGIILTSPVIFHFSRAILIHVNYSLLDPCKLVNSRFM
jgi:hypothetical protein